MKKEKKKRAFTLVELMVVIVIIAFVMALLLPALRGARKKAQAMACASNLRQLGVAWSTYAADFDGYFPAVSDTTDYGRGAGVKVGFVPWPQYFVLGGYVDSRKIYYCKAAEVVVDYTVSEPDDTSEEAALRNHDGGTYGLNLGVSCNIYGQVSYSSYWDQQGEKAGWELLPGQAHTIYAPEDKVLMADRVPGVPLWPFDVKPVASGFHETYRTNCAIWGVPPATNYESVWKNARVDFRHPGRRANALFCDMHVGTLRSGEYGVFFPRKEDEPDYPYVDSCYRQGLASTDYPFFRWAAFSRRRRED
jgi:prepilin-type N-terminal cleavage/methylation domain-containing protein/prepilin-type processing-associated H-X9-DG protein